MHTGIVYGMNSLVSGELTWINKPHDAFVGLLGKLLCSSKLFTMIELKLAGLLD